MSTYDPTICCLQDTHFRSKYINKVKVKEQKKNYMQIQIQRDQADCPYIRQNRFQVNKKVMRDKEGHYILRKEYRKKM